MEARSQREQKREPKEILEFDVRASDWITSHPSARVALRRNPPEEQRYERELFPGFLLSLTGVAGLATWLARAATNGKRGRRSAPIPILGRSLLLAGAAFAVLSKASVFIALARVIPGLDSMRVPTRGHLFVLLAVAVLAASFLARFAKRSLAVCICLFLVSIDLSAKPFPEAVFFDLPSDATAPPHVSWLRRPEVKAVANLPIKGQSVEARMMWLQKFHGRPIVNGYSSYLPESFRWMRYECRSRQNRLLSRCIDALEESGVSHVVIDDSWYASPGAPLDSRVDAAISLAAQERVRLVFSDGVALVFELR
jgi:hypothetical protein